MHNLSAPPARPFEVDHMPRPDSQNAGRKPYESPVVIKVNVDPQQELLQSTNCAFHTGDNATCNASPGA